jgi:23S rRNA (pseudouridine1915-N3)-methyltransferase
MQKIRLIWVGKTKERYLSEGINYYLKLLTPMTRLAVAEIKEEKGKARGTSLAAEAQRILKQSDGFYLLDERGKHYSSPELAGFLKERQDLDFVLGGAFGVSDEVRERSKGCIALSKMTLTHEMARLLFLEQLYRAYTILKGKEYHH